MKKYFCVFLVNELDEIEFNWIPILLAIGIMEIGALFVIAKILLSELS